MTADVQNIKDVALTILLGWCVWEFKLVRTSIDSLNIKIAVVIEKLGYHEKRIEKLEQGKSKKWQNLAKEV